MLELQSGRRSRCSRIGPVQGMAASSSGIPDLSPATEEAAAFFSFLCCSFECFLYSSFFHVLLVPSPQMRVSLVRFYTWCRNSNEEAQQGRRVALPWISWLLMFRVNPELPQEQGYWWAVSSKWALSIELVLMPDQRKRGKKQRHK